MSMWINRDKETGYRWQQAKAPPFWKATLFCLLWGEIWSLVHVPWTKPLFSFSLFIPEQLQTQSKTWIKQMFLIPCPVPKCLFCITWVFKCLICGSRLATQWLLINWSRDNLLVWDIAHAPTLRKCNAKTRTVPCFALQQVEHTSTNWSNLLKSLHRKRLYNLSFQGLT